MTLADTIVLTLPETLINRLRFLSTARAEPLDDLAADALTAGLDLFDKKRDRRGRKGKDDAATRFGRWLSEDQGFAPSTGRAYSSILRRALLGSAPEVNLNRVRMLWREFCEDRNHDATSLDASNL